MTDQGLARMRLQKWIAQSGRLSRRKAEEAITQGRVTLNGKIITELGQTLDPSHDQVALDGIIIETRPALRTFLFHKPQGVMTTKKDQFSRKCVADFFKDEPELNPVGRLDYDSEGLLMMTSDGDLLLKLTHPRYEIKKTYQVEFMNANAHSSRFDDHALDQALQKLIHGVSLPDGMGKFLSVTCVNKNLNPDQYKHYGRYEVVVKEGRNRFIRRMFEAIGFEVTRLIRTKMGPFELGVLKPGEKQEVSDPWRMLESKT